MITAWTKHLKTAEEIDEFETYVKSSRRLLNRLKEILDEQITHMDFKEYSAKDFEDPNWAYKQAFRNGQRSTLNALLKLIDLDRGTNEHSSRGQL